MQDFGVQKQKRQAGADAAAEARRAYYKEYRARNREKVKEYYKEYRARNRDKVKEWNIRYWERRAQKEQGEEREQEHGETS